WAAKDKAGGKARVKDGSTTAGADSVGIFKGSAKTIRNFVPKRKDWATLEVPAGGNSWVTNGQALAAPVPGAA
ncbi:MAG TPA: hypothetical protein VKY92_20540, partial [Verrucomicrobiae bacterium]|nr:hypothetical protein [Verrucomicrobiae bacterium]